ncbi:uncharacterized protein LOC117827189 [Notolabrus celidotus]|uniref:uncharacterized protein LOC117827189 n=1 Tax=Notolabrus celidotus TaxID=1203425 RepID=UPI001490271B|nr:uncharacterized protein LOC117827189 [Notolabrus celidotus]
MGNTFCPSDEVSYMSSIARDVCPFPDYTPSPLFTNMLSINSSLHLSNHYTAVQSSLNPKQLEDFTQSLRSTFGKEGRVSYGGVGVVALSLAVLFDTLAKQAKGEQVSDSGPIPGLFIKDVRGYYSPLVHTISEYLRLVPHIANNPTRMREEAKRYLLQIKIDYLSLEKMKEDPSFQLNKSSLPFMQDTAVMNLAMAVVFSKVLRTHYLNINGTESDEIMKFNPQLNDPPTYNLNCDPETADKEFVAAAQNLPAGFQNAFKNKLPQSTPFLIQAAEADSWNSMFLLSSCSLGDVESRSPYREDFDLKANALWKWNV